MDKKEILARVKVLANTANLDEDETTELNKLNGELAAIKGKEDAAKLLASADEDAEAERAADTKKQIEEAVKKERVRLEAEGRRLPDYSGAPHQTQYSDTYKYDDLDATDLSLMIEMGKSLGVQPSIGAMKAMSLRVADMKDDNTEDGRKALAYVKGSFKAKTRTNIDPTKEAVEAAIKAATDPMYTGGSGIGSDWVGTAYSTELWRVIRAENRVAKNIPSVVIPDGYSNETFPVESTDVTWYKVPEAASSDGTLKYPAATVPASQIATLNKNMTVSKMGARALYTGELTEDSLIAFAPQLRIQFQISGDENIESMIIDGDVETSASKNINAIDTTPGSTDAYLSFDGFRKLALVTNTANSRSASGTLTIQDYKATMQLMGVAGLAGVDPTKIAFIVDGNVHYKNMDLPEVLTREVAGSAATVFEGFLKAAYGVQIIPSWQMHKASAKRMANTAGKIDADTDSNNTTGVIVCVRWDQWKLGYKRRMTMETTRFANSDSWEIVALARLGLLNRDNEASAVTYNVGV